MKKIRLELAILPLVSVVLGVYVLTHPWSATETLCRLIGWLVLLAGGIGVLNAVTRQRATLMSDPALPISVAGAVIGLYFITHPRSLIDLVGLFLCVFLLIEGMTNIQNSVQRKRWGDSLWWAPLAVGCVCIVLGLMALFAPWAYTTLVMRIVGGLLLFSGVVNLILVFLSQE